MRIPAQRLPPGVADRPPEPLERAEAVTTQPDTAEHGLGGKEQDGRHDVRVVKHSH